MGFSFTQFLNRQYAVPDGWFGRFFIAPYLDRSNRRSHEFIYQNLDIDRCQSVLEVGFGGGKFLLRLAREFPLIKFVGAEYSHEMLNRLTSRLARSSMPENIGLVEGSVESLPLESNQFDCVYSINTIYFWPNRLKGLVEISRLLTIDGELVIGMASDAALRLAQYDTQIFTITSLEELADDCAQAGLKISDVKSLNRGERGDFYVCKIVRVR
ncbi:MAG: ubiquinone/menaquinone biosynthesis C-methylase UbiE [Gammaproteobacteria bacterium]|jgi:ubiquinone/menaquinone biosynthesis C-methylase UbiE